MCLKLHTTSFKNRKFTHTPSRNILIDLSLSASQGQLSILSSLEIHNRKWSKGFKRKEGWPVLPCPRYGLYPGFRLYTDTVFCSLPSGCIPLMIVTLVAKPPNDVPIYQLGLSTTQSFVLCVLISHELVLFCFIFCNGLCLWEGAVFILVVFFLMRTEIYTNLLYKHKYWGCSLGIVLLQ